MRSTDRIWKIISNTGWILGLVFGIADTAWLDNHRPRTAMGDYTVAIFSRSIGQGHTVFISPDDQVIRMAGIALCAALFFVGGFMSGQFHGMFDRDRDGRDGDLRG
jgi:hypothetical protein